MWSCIREEKDRLKKSVLTDVMKALDICEKSVYPCSNPSVASNFGDTICVHYVSIGKFFVSSKAETENEKYHIGRKAFRIGFYRYKPK